MSTDHRGHQFRLLGQRRYGPFFCAVTLGTINDNLLKFAVTLLLTWHVPLPGLSAADVGPLTGALFILPSLLLSASAGQWADKWPLDRLIRWGKALEIAMMALAAWALWHREGVWLLACLLLSGTHVTVFATLKYAYLPRHLGDAELIGGNGLMEMGLFTGILIGTLTAGILMDAGALWPGLPPDLAAWLVPVALIGLAVLGWLCAQGVPATPAVDPALRLHFNPVRDTWVELRRVAGQRGGLLPVLGISWMWFFGAIYLSLFPVLTKEILHGAPSVATVLLVVMSLGIGVGALSCEALAHRRLPPARLVVLGATGMALFAADLAVCAWMLTEGRRPGDTSVLDWRAFVAEPDHLRVLLDVWCMAMAVGWFSVPLYARLQQVAEPSHRARLIAANNIVNALFILMSAALVGGLLAVGVSLAGVLGVTAALQGLFCLVAWVRHRAMLETRPWKN